MCTAIENKGVAVWNASLDDYASCIDAIDQWGSSCYPYLIDAVIVWWGGWWGSGKCLGSSSSAAWWWWGWWGVRFIDREWFFTTSWCIIVWQWWAGGTSGNDWCDGCPSCLWNYISRGWWGGGAGTNVGHAWASWWGAWMYNSSSCTFVSGWNTQVSSTATTPRAWHDGGASIYYRSCNVGYGWWWGGACGMWGTNNTHPNAIKCWVWWTWIWMGGGVWASVFPSMYISAWWWGWGGASCSAAPSSCPWGNGGTCVNKNGWDGQTYWSGGWWAWGSSCQCKWWNWHSWIVVIKYPTNWDYWFTCATWWTVTTSWSYKIHTFTSNWTFTIVS